MHRSFLGSVREANTPLRQDDNLSELRQLGRRQVPPRAAGLAKPVLRLGRDDRSLGQDDKVFVGKCSVLAAAPLEIAAAVAMCAGQNIPA